MPLKEKNNLKDVSGALFLSVLFFTACGPKNKEQNPEEKRFQDSLLKVESQLKLDSMKRTNPFLIMPPDSQYTGEYVDKYENGVIKFKGFFRFGQRHGPWLAFYPNGMMWSECHYDKGLKEGPITTYYQNGRKRFEGFHKHDLKDSTWIYYDTAEVVLSKIVYREDRVSSRLPVEQPKK